MSLRSMLERCLAQFDTYANNHIRKAQAATDPAVAQDARAKAHVNGQLVYEIAQELGDDLAFTSMVTRLQKPGEAILAAITPVQIMSVHMAGGAASEAGELFDAIKRWAIYGKELDRANVIEELGDLEFFLEGLRQNLSIERETTLLHNRMKLEGSNGRYKDGYSDAAAIARADKQADAFAHYGGSGEFAPASSTQWGEPGTVPPTPSDPLGQGLSGNPDTQLGEPRQHIDDVDRQLPRLF